MNILIIDDDAEIVNIITLTLRVGWPDAKVFSANTGNLGLGMVETESPDLVILDLGLPEISGFQVLHNLRLFSDIPVVILTASGEESNVVRALDMGANDYLTKPFRQMELLARLKSAARLLYHSTEFESCQRIGPFQFYPASRKIEHDGRTIRLTPSESLLLLHFVRNHDKALTHSCLAHCLWSQDYPGASNAIRVYVGNLRKKLERDYKQPEIIRTVPGIGYIFSQK